MISYVKKERAKYCLIPCELMAQYRDGSHSVNDEFGDLWWRHGSKNHRDEDKPAYISRAGRLAWWKNDLLHRDGDKPAFISRAGELRWYQNGKKHRFSGPAQIYSDGSLEWWISGEDITLEVNLWLNGLLWRGTSDQIFEFQLRFT